MENNTQNPEIKENNKKLIIISSIAIVVLVAAFVVVGICLGWFGGKKGSEKGSVTAPTINIEETKGSESKTIKKKISVRDVKFGDKVKSVKKFEKDQADTLDGPTESTKDGYTFLTYRFNDQNAKIFGVKPAASTSGAMLQYMFKKNKLFDIRILYGDISKNDEKALRKTLTKKYGDPTFSTKYSDGSIRELWKTDAKNIDNQTILSFNSSKNGGVTVTYERVGR